MKQFVIHSTANSKSINMVTLLFLPQVSQAINTVNPVCSGFSLGEEHRTKGSTPFIANRKQASVSTSNYNRQLLSQKLTSILMADIPRPTIFHI